MLQDYTFTQSRSKRYWYCSKKAAGCKARIKMHLDEVTIMQAMTEHIHDRTPYYVTKTGKYVFLTKWVRWTVETIFSSQNSTMFLKEKLAECIRLLVSFSVLMEDFRSLGSACTNSSSICFRFKLLFFSFFQNKQTL